MIAAAGYFELAAIRPDARCDAGAVPDLRLRGTK